MKNDKVKEYEKHFDNAVKALREEKAQFISDICDADYLKNYEIHYEVTFGYDCLPELKKTRKRRIINIDKEKRK